MEAVMLQKVCPQDDFFLESLDDPELVSLSPGASPDLEGHRAEVIQSNNVCSPAEQVMVPVLDWVGFGW
jgi:hypothetical protein